MSQKLAIKGHSTRGKEVIELLEMLGGKNIHNLYGNNSFEYYVSGHAILNDRLSIIEDDDFVIFNLEEFLEKYPFKVGDKVHIYVQNDDTDGRYDVEVAEISSMRWNPARCKIAYKMKDINREFYKEEIKCKVDDSTKSIDNPIDSSQFMQLGKTVAVCFNTANYENEVELKLGDYEIVVRDGKTYAVRKKPAYPDNYEECVRIAKNIHGYDINIDAPAYRELLESFVKLLICRDAYWKIAGEEMGLGKPWEPDWLDETTKYGIWTYQNTIITDNVIRTNHMLVFPTPEIRDVFYENFKDLIERCKELL